MPVWVSVCVCVCVCVCTHVHTYTCIYKHAQHIHTRTRTHAHTCTIHSHSHIHIYTTYMHIILELLSSLPDMKNRHLTNKPSTKKTPVCVTALEGFEGFLFCFLFPFCFVLFNTFLHPWLHLILLCQQVNQ